jgi:hypothetical protein
MPRLPSRSSAGLRAGVVLAGALACGPAGGQPAGPAGDAGWRLDPRWDDGRAEYCAYRVTWRRYGTLWPGSALLVLVKEPWAPDLDVKADRPRPDGFDVLKLNHVRDVRTGIYAYHQMASVFLDRQRGGVVKLATTSSEACGITTATMTDGRLTAHSYFDGQGERTLAYPGGLPEDGLPALLRDFVAGEAPPRVAVFPSLLGGRLPPLEAAAWRLRRLPAAPLELPAGTFRAVELRLERGAEWRRYLFDAEPPHPLLALEADDGTRYELARCQRLAYWEHHTPGDEEWLPPELR